jgi:hypothetical protein
MQVPSARALHVPHFREPAPAASKVNEWHPVAPYMDKNLDSEKAVFDGQNSCGGKAP